MATDYLSALNVGSGLNTTEIIDSLVNAERAPRESLITAAKEEKTVSISALGTVKTELSTLNTSLGVIKTVNGLAPIQSGNSVAIEISDANEASAFSHQIQVSNLAKAQTLAFDGFTSASQSLGAGSLTISFGAWNSSSGVFTADSNQSDQTITIADGNDTLTDVKDTINAADIGVYASIIDTGDGNFTLLVTSETGENNALRIVASETVSNSGLAGLDFSSYDASQEVISATDANFSIDGLDVVRETNIIDDVFDGIKMTLVSTTSSAETIGASWDSATALAAMNSFVISINDFRTTLSNLSSRGVNGAESGPLAGNSLT
jgi:flagellar hook-associated protein 2